MSKDQSDEPKVTPVDRSDVVDWVLEGLVAEANARKATFADITLLVHGLVVSGTLVGVTEYYRSATSVFHKGKEEPGEGTWGAYFSDLASQTEKLIDGELEREETLEKLCYVHLKNARIFTNGQRPLPSNQGVWWRGKLANIDAFWFGKLKAGDDDE